MNYQESLDFLYEQLPIFQRVGKAAMKADLTNTIVLADRLGNPEKKFKSIHIAGTNGKGSTAHMYASVLQSAGYKVGLYTSPHLKSFRERIRINGEMVSEAFVIDFVQRCKDLMLEVKPSFFEITVIMAFEYFAQQEIDVAVIETGLGGRLDSTNIIAPDLAVITSVSRDHEDILGAGIENIAREKAGIIKAGKPVVIGRLPREAEVIVEKTAKEKQAKLVKAHEAYQSKVIDESTMGITATRLQSRFTYESDLRGSSLHKNLPIVLAACDVLNHAGYRISDMAIADGIQKVVTQTGLRGRWQQLREKPRVLVDIGHNEEAVIDLMTRLKSMNSTGKLRIVWGMAADKDVAKIMDLLIKDASYYFCAADIPRALPVQQLVDYGESKGLRYQSFDTVSEAYDKAILDSMDDDLVFVGGSTFVVAEIKDL